VQLVVAAVRPPLPGTARAVVIGSAIRAAQLRKSPLVVNPTRLSILGFIPAKGDDPSSMGPLDDLVWILDRYSINTVMIAEQLDEDVLIDVLKICDDTGCTAIAASPLCPVGGFIPRVSMLGHQPYVELYRPSLRAPQLAVKRIFDVVFGSVLLVLSLPILAIAALAIAWSCVLLAGSDRLRRAAFPHVQAANDGRGRGGKACAAEIIERVQRRQGIQGSG
jgi:hypothetical protein